MRSVHRIETESYRRLRELVDLSHLGPLSRAVAERVIHASADLEYAKTLVLDEVALERGLKALRRGAPIVADVGMVAAGVTARELLCFVSDERAELLSEHLHITRSAAGFRLAEKEAGFGADGALRAAGAGRKAGAHRRAAGRVRGRRRVEGEAGRERATSRDEPRAQGRIRGGGGGAERAPVLRGGMI
jgi:hypothetical protein